MLLLDELTTFLDPADQLLVVEAVRRLVDGPERVTALWVRRVVLCGGVVVCCVVGVAWVCGVLLCLRADDNSLSRPSSPACSHFLHPRPSRSLLLRRR